jgi:hypothetical protein
MGLCAMAARGSKSKAITEMDFIATTIGVTESEIVRRKRGKEPFASVLLGTTLRI